MRLTSEPQEWTPIDPNLENELLSAYARIEELEEVKSNLEGNCGILIEKLNASSDLRNWELKIVRAKATDFRPKWVLYGSFKVPFISFDQYKEDKND